MHAEMGAGAGAKLNIFPSDLVALALIQGGVSYSTSFGVYEIMRKLSGGSGKPAQYVLEVRGVPTANLAYTFFF